MIYRSPHEVHPDQSIIVIDGAGNEHYKILAYDDETGELTKYAHDEYGDCIAGPDDGAPIRETVVVPLPLKIRGVTEEPEIEEIMRAQRG